MLPLMLLHAPSTVAADLPLRTSDLLPGRIAYWDQDLRCRFANQTLCDWLGKPSSEVIGRRLSDLLDKPRADALRERLDSALRGEVQVFELNEIGLDGRGAVVRVRYEPDIQNGVVCGFFAITTDATQEHQAELRLQRLNVELALERDNARDSAAAKSMFLANMGHEIRTPLNAIIGLTHLLRRDPGGTQAPERLTRVADAAEKLLALVNDVLDLSKIESGLIALAQTEFDMQSVVEHVRLNAEERARGKQLALRIDMGSMPRLVRGDKNRLVQALDNLVANAVKFTEGGSIALTGTLLETRGESLHLLFEVRDTGIGIAADRLEGIFDAFEQGDGSSTRRFGGTGLGLGITRQLARLMGGDAGVTSELGVGSTFWISVVLRRVGTDLSALPPAHGPLAGRRALLVDDLAEAHALMEPMMRRLGVEVELASSGAQALELVRAAEDSGDPFDVVLIDWLMPHMDGLETARRLIAQTRGTPPKCLLVSVSVDNRMREQALASGVDDLLQKPVSFSTLNDHLMSMLVEPQSYAEAIDPDQVEAERHLREAHAGKTLLIAEDNPVNQDIARTLLNMAGLKADVASTGREALEMASVNNYPLILMDVQMPEIDGIQATRLLRARSAYATTPIIAMTANAYPQDRAACLAVGMNEYLTKPVDAATLYSVLSRWLELPDVTRSESIGVGAASVSTDALEGIEGLSVDRGLAFLGGNRAALCDALRKMVELYDAGLPEVAAFLGQTASDATILPLRAALHSIGGASAALGLEALSDAAMHIGELLRSPELQRLEVDEELRALAAQLEHTLSQIQDRLG